MSFTTKIIIFLIGIAVLAGVATMIIEPAKYISTAAILAILVVLGYKLYVVLFKNKTEN